MITGPPVHPVFFCRVCASTRFALSNKSTPRAPPLTHTKAMWRRGARRSSLSFFLTVTLWCARGGRYYIFIATNLKEARCSRARGVFVLLLLIAVAVRRRRALARRQIVRA